MNFHEAAAPLARLGLKVHPLRTGRKLPLLDGWPDLATDDPEQIAEWAAEFPNANVAIATGHRSKVVAIDVDMKDGKNGQATLDTLARHGKVLPPAPSFLTPSGGRQILFRAPPGLHLPNAVEVHSDGRGLGPGVDFRGDGGQAVMPPSVLTEWRKGNKLIHGAGVYRWLVPPMSPDFPKLPGWAVQMLTPPPPKPRKAFNLERPEDHEGYKRQALADLRDMRASLASISDGRHEAPFKAACTIGKYVAHGLLSDSEVNGAIADACEFNGAMKDYGRKDIEKQIARGLKRASGDGLPPLHRNHRRT
jgi:putative DNA primase/helicase